MKSWLAAIRWRWLLLALCSYCLFLIITLPVSLFTKRLSAQGIFASDLSGTIWKGSAASLQMRGTSLGAVRWHVHPTSLLLGRLTADINAKRVDGFFDSSVTVRRSGRLQFQNLKASLPIPLLSSLASINDGMLGGWKGKIDLQLSELAIENGWPTQLVGRIDASELVGPARQPAAIGSYHIDFAAQATPNSNMSSNIAGNIASQDDSPLDVAGTVQLQPGRQYRIDAQVGTRANAPASISKALEYLGPADAQGRRPLSLSGSI